MRICGPKLSMFGIIISIWGIVQLFLMAIFFSIHAVALIEDLPEDAHIPEAYPTLKDFFEATDESYRATAANCWRAALIYIATLAVSIWQFHINCRDSLLLK